MALASLEDIKRVLRLTTVDEERDERLRASLAAIESWAATTRLRNLGKEGSRVETFFDVAGDATLHLTVQDATVTLVKTFWSPTMEGTVLSNDGLGHGYDLTDDGKVILRGGQGYAGYGYAFGSGEVTFYSRVEVHYMGSGQIPRDVTEGIALLAAGYYEDTPGMLSSLGALKSEKIGDYSYTLADASAGTTTDTYVSKAMWFLRPHLRRRQVSVC